MAGITMCVTAGCPKGRQCRRKRAPAYGLRQSYGAWRYVHATKGGKARVFQCDGFLPIAGGKG
jgi:hypothetical protein